MTRSSRGARIAVKPLSRGCRRHSTHPFVRTVSQCSDRGGSAPIGFAIAIALSAALARLLFSEERPVARCGWSDSGGGVSWPSGTRAAAAVGCANTPVLFAALVVVAGACVALARRRGAPLSGRRGSISRRRRTRCSSSASSGCRSSPRIFSPFGSTTRSATTCRSSTSSSRRGASGGAVPPTSNYDRHVPARRRVVLSRCARSCPTTGSSTSRRSRFGVLGALAVAGHRAGRWRGAPRAPLASRPASTWIAMPAVFLQLPTELRRRRVRRDAPRRRARAPPRRPRARPSARRRSRSGCTSDRKPQAPASASRCSAGLMLVRAWPRRGLALGLAGVVAVLGAESYVANGDPLRQPRVSGRAWTSGRCTCRGIRQLARLRALVGAGAIRGAARPPRVDVVVRGRRAGRASTCAAAASRAVRAALAILVAVYFVVRRRQWLFAWLLLCRGRVARSRDRALRAGDARAPALAARRGADRGLVVPRADGRELGRRGRVGVRRRAAPLPRSPARARRSPAYVAMEWPRARDRRRRGRVPRGTLLARCATWPAPGDAFGFDLGFDFTHLAFRPDFSTNARFFPREEPTAAARSRRSGASA